MAWRWFVGVSLNEAAWDGTVIHQNRARCPRVDVAQQWLAAVVRMLQQRHRIDEEFQRGRDADRGQRQRAELSAETESTSSRQWPARRVAEAGHACIAHRSGRATVSEKQTGCVRLSYLGHLVMETSMG